MLITFFDRFAIKSEVLNRRFPALLHHLLQIVYFELSRRVARDQMLINAVKSEGELRCGLQATFGVRIDDDFAASCHNGVHRRDGAVHLKPGIEQGEAHGVETTSQQRAVVLQLLDDDRDHASRVELDVDNRFQSLSKVVLHPLHVRPI